MVPDVPTRLESGFPMLGTGLPNRGPTRLPQRLPCRLLPSLLLVPLACGHFYLPCFLNPGLHGCLSSLGRPVPARSTSTLITMRLERQAAICGTSAV